MIEIIALIVLVLTFINAVVSIIERVCAYLAKKKKD